MSKKTTNLSPAGKRLLKKVVFNTIFMVFLSFAWLHSPCILYTEFAEMGEINHIIRLCKEKLGVHQDKKDLDDFIYINTSKSPQLIKNQFDTSYREIVTNRKQLVNILHQLSLHKDKFNFIVCDILFDMADMEDSATDHQLVREIENLNSYHKMIIPYFNDTATNYTPLKINCDNGIPEYKTYAQNAFYKFDLLYDSKIKTIAYKMYAHDHQDRVHHFHFGSRDDSCNYDQFWGGFLKFHFVNYRIGLNRMIPKLIYTRKDIENKMDNLANIDETWMDVVLNSYTNKPVIFIGDFQKEDQHLTINDQMSGPLIIINTYFAFMKGQHIFSWLYILFITLGYALISYLLFTEKKLHSDHQKQLSNIKRLILWIWHEKHFFILFIIMILSSEVFGHHLFILLMTIYVALVEVIHNSFYLKKKNVKHISDPEKKD